MVYTLLLIDFQPGFIDPDPDFAFNLNELIDKAMNENADIVVCEFFGFGSSWKMIRKKLSKYEHKYVIRKKDQDGGRHVNSRLSKLKLKKIHEIRVAGLYADMCVKDTVMTLAELMPKSNFIILRKFCIASGYKEDAWNLYKNRKVKNLKLK